MATEQMEWWPWLAAVKQEALPHLPTGWDGWLEQPILFTLTECYNDGLDPVDAASEVVWQVTQ